MPVQAGTAYVKIEPDFTAFNRKLHQEVRLKPVTQDVHVKVDESSLKKATSSIAEHTRKVAEHSKVYEGLKSTITGTTAALVGGGGLVEALVESAKAGAAQETAAARLGKAVENAGLSWKGHREEVEKWIETTGRAKGFMDTDLSNAYANMIRTTGSFTEAQTLLNDAMDISRTKGVDLASAQSLVARVYNGSYMGLKRLGIAITPVTAAQDKLRESTAKINAEQQHQIDLIRESNMKSDEKKKAIDKIKEATSTATDAEKQHAKAMDASATRTEALGLIQQKFGGQAATYARTTSGHYAQLKVSLDQVEETIGKAILPTLDQLAQKGVKVAGDFQKHWPEIKQDIKDVVGPMRDVAGAVVDFTKNNPDLAKAAISVGLMATAAVKIKNSAAAQGITGFIKLLAGLAGARGGGLGGGGGVIGTVRSVLSAEKPIPVIVMNPGFGGGTGALGKLGGGAATAEEEAALAAGGGVAKEGEGLLSKLGAGIGKAGMIGGGGLIASQLVGSLVGGKTGSMISTIGSGASIGAGLGSFVGPEGTAVGAVLGGGIAAGISLFFKKHDTGKDIAKSIFSKGFGQESLNAGQTVADLLNKGFKARSEQWVRDPKNPFGAPILDAAKGAQAQQDFQQAGSIVAQTLEQGWNQYKFQSEPTMFEQFRGKAKQLPPAAQAAAAQSAIAFARGLEKQGRLPKGAAQKMIQDITRQFPNLPRVAGKTADQVATAFDLGKRLAKTRTDVKAQLDKMRGDFPEVVDAMDKTKGGVENKAAAVVTALKNIIKNGTGPMKKQAQKDLDALRQTTASDFADMEKTTFAKMPSIRGKTTAEAAALAQGAASSFGTFQWSVISAMANSTLATSKGMTLIGQAANAILTAFGGAKVPIPVLKSLSPQDLQLALSSPQGRSALENYGGSSTQGHGPKNIGAGGLQAGQGTSYAGGALMQIGMPGATGYDTIPLNVAGTPVMVGSGEQVAVLNRHQQAFLNTVLSPMGGLAGMFSTINRPHYMASGGSVNLYGHPAPDANVMSLIGTMERQFPGLAVSSTTDYTHAANSYHYRGEAVDMAADQGTMQRAAAWVLSSGLCRSLAEGIHNPNLSVKFGKQVPSSLWGASTWAEHLNHIHLAILGALGAVTGGGATSLKAPVVSGKGAPADAARSVLHKATRAANAYISAHLPAGGDMTDLSVAAGGSPAAARAWTAQAMKIAGVSGPLWTNMLLRQEMRESSFNPNSVNTTDINAQRGDPSKGILQTTGSTFRQYMLAGHGNILNPVDNIIAAIRYMIARYGGGDPARAAQVMWARGGGAYTGGGFIPAAQGLLLPTGQVRGLTAKPPKHPASPLRLKSFVNPVVNAAGKLKKGAKYKTHAKHSLQALINKIHRLGLPDVTSFANTITDDQARQQAAASLIDTDVISQSLVGDTSWYHLSDDGSQYIVNTDQMHKLVAPLLPLVPPGSGLNALQWLAQEITDMAVYRNHLINLHNIIATNLVNLRAALKVAQDRAKKLRTQIRTITNRINKLVGERNALTTKLAGLNKQHPKGKAAQKSLAASKAIVQGQIKSKDAAIKTARGTLASPQAELDALTKQDTGIIPTLNTKITDFVDASGTTSDNLSQLQGPVAGSLQYAKKSGNYLLHSTPGEFLGDIFTALQSYTGFWKDVNITPPDVPATQDTSVPVNQYTIDLARLGLERGAVQALQQLVIQGAGTPTAPYGGSFAGGGQVPGPPGMPRTVIAHGHEWIVPEDQIGGGDTHVYIDGKGMSLNDLIDVRVEQRTRGQARGADRNRKLPGARTLK